MSFYIDTVYLICIFILFHLAMSGTITTLLEQIIVSRRSTRHFTNKIPSKQDIDVIVESAIYAPYWGATGIPLWDIRKIFVIQQNSDKMKKLSELLLSAVKKNARGLNILLKLLPFLQKKMWLFANKLNILSENGMQSLYQAPYYIIVAEKKWFPPIEKQSIAHALENMWLTATNLWLGFQLISATGGLMSKNKEFLDILGLEKGKYQIDGCLVGYATKYPDTVREFDREKFVTWIT